MTDGNAYAWTGVDRLGRHTAGRTGRGLAQSRTCHAPPAGHRTENAFDENALREQEAGGGKRRVKTGRHRTVQPSDGDHAASGRSPGSVVRRGRKECTKPRTRGRDRNRSPRHRRRCTAYVPSWPSFRPCSTTCTSAWSAWANSRELSRPCWNGSRHTRSGPSRPGANSPKAMTYPAVCRSRCRDRHLAVADPRRPAVRDRVCRRRRRFFPGSPGS